MAVVGFEFRFHFGAEGIEDDLSASAFFEDADWEAASAGADEEAIAWDLGLEDHFCGKEFAEGLGGFAAFGEVLLDHGEADSEDGESGVHDAEAVEAFEEFGDGADAEGFGLLWDEDGIAGGDDIAGDAEEACGGIDEAEVEAAGGGTTEEGADASEVAAVSAAAGFVVAGLAAGDEGEGFEAGGDDEAIEGYAGVCEEVVEAGEQAGLPGEREADGALRVGIDEQGSDACAGKRVSKID